jgi:hypothetical protein
MRPNNTVCLSIGVLLFAGGCGSGASNASSDSWPSQWTANIAWSTFDSAGAKTNTWTGKVSYDWTLRAMRTDVTPPTAAGAQQDTFGPPISGSGSMLMRDGKLYTIPANGECDVASGLGAPMPDWLTTSNGTADSVPGTERLLVDLEQLEPGSSGCFSYVRSKQDHSPRVFGGAPTCASWPAGSFIEYSDFAQRPSTPDIFAVPPSCTPNNTPPSQLCQRCHDH